jgi:hypothetical protein
VGFCQPDLGKGGSRPTNFGDGKNAVGRTVVVTMSVMSVSWTLAWVAWGPQRQSMW